MKFIESQTVNQYINEKGVEGLPVVTLDDDIIIMGRYPTNVEILTLLELPPELLLPEGATEVSNSCCCGTNEEDDQGGCCCGGNC